MINRLLKFPNVYLTLTILLGVLPFLVYFFENRIGLISTSEVWYATGVNHGPWRGGIESLTIYYPVLILLLTTIFTFFSKYLKDKKWNLVVYALVLILIQIGFLVTQMYFLTWLID